MSQILTHRQLSYIVKYFKFLKSKNIRYDVRVEKAFNVHFERSMAVYAVTLSYPSTQIDNVLSSELTLINLSEDTHKEFLETAGLI